MLSPNKRLFIFLFLLVVPIFFSFAGNMVSATDRHLTGCQELQYNDSVYYLDNDVYAAGTCFNITNSNGLISNMTLDCQGYTIYYGENVSGSGFKSVVWSPRHDLGVRNCNFIQRNNSVTQTYGVELASVNGVIMNNNNFTIDGNSSAAIYLHDSDRYPAAAYNFNITNTNIVSTSDGGIGVFIDEGTANGTIDGIDMDITDYGGGYALGMGGTYTNITNVGILGTGNLYGIRFFRNNTGYNRISNCDIILDSYGSGAGILFYNSAVGNVIRNCGIYVTNHSDNYVVKWWGGAGGTTDNHFINTTLSMSGGEYNQSWILIMGGGDNYFTNVSWYPTTPNTYWFYSSGQDENFWHGYLADIYVNDTIGDPVSGATVTIQFSNGSTWRTGVTNGSGYLIDQEVPYRQINHTQSPWRENMYNYSNFNFSATKTGQGMDYEVKNMTQNWIDTNKIVLTLDAVGPENITLVAPTNNSWRNNDSMFSFLCNITGNSLTNATLWGNWSGVWAANKTDTLSGNQDIAQFIFGANEILEGTYKWTCYACDVSGCRFANVNWTLNNDYTAPSAWLWRPDQGSTQDDGNITFQLKCYDGDSGPGSLELYGNWSEPVEDPKATNASPLNNVWWDVNQSITSNGVYSWYGLCYDEAGNYKQTPSKWFIVDNTTTRVTGCMNITSPGYYVLQNDINAHLANPCIKINASNVTLYGNGYNLYNASTGIYLVSVNNVTIDGNNISNSSSGIILNTANNVTIDGNNISNITGGLSGGVDLFAGNFITISHNNFYDSINSNGIRYQNSSQINITNNNFYNNGEGIQCVVFCNNTLIINNSLNNQLDSGIILDTANNVTIDGNNISNNSGGSQGSIYAVSSKEIIIHNNQITDFSGEGIHINLVNSSIISNNFINKSSIPNPNGIFVEASNYSIISNNVILNMPDYGISSEANSKNLIINNNTITNASFGIYLSSANNVTIDGNNISECSSYGITTVGGVYYLNLSNNNIYGVCGFDLLGNSTFINNLCYGRSPLLEDSTFWIASEGYNYFYNNNFTSNNYSISSIRINGNGNPNTANLINQTIGDVNFNLEFPTISPLGVLDLDRTIHPSDPVDYKNIGKYLNISATSVIWTRINISYNTTDLQGRNESTLSLWKYNGSWYNATYFASSYGVDTVNDVVWANITSFNGIFAPMLDETINLTGCGFLDLDDTTYTLSQNVSSTGSCFVLQADNVTLDCNGYAITYAIKGTLEGYAVTDIEGHQDFTIENCQIITGNYTNNSHGLNLIGTNNTLISGNTFTINGSGSFGVNIDGTGGAADSYDILSNNFGIFNEDSEYAIFASGVQNHYVYNNIINTTATGGTGILYMNSLDNQFVSNEYYTNGTSAYDFGSILTSNGIIVEDLYKNPLSTNYEEINGTFNSISPQGLFIDYRNSPAEDPDNYTNISKYLFITGYNNFDFYWFFPNFNMTDYCGPEMSSINCGWTSDKTTCNTCSGCNYSFGSCGGTIDCHIFDGQQLQCEELNPVCQWTAGPDTCDLNLDCIGANESLCEYIQQNGWGCSMSGNCASTIPPKICTDLTNETGCSTECGGAFGCSWVNGSDVNESNLKLLRYTGGAWRLVNSTVDTTDNFIFSDMYAPINGYGTFAIMEEISAGHTGVSKPENLSIYLNEDNITVWMNWSVVSGAEGYFVYSSDNLTELLQLVPGQEFYERVTLVGENNNTYNDTTSNEENIIFYRVAAFTDGGLTTNISNTNETIGKYIVTIGTGESMFSLPLNQSDAIENFIPTADEFASVYTYDGRWKYDYYFMGEWIKEFDNLTIGDGYWTVDFLANTNMSNIKKIVTGEINQTINRGEGTLGWESITTGETMEALIPSTNEFASVYTYDGGWKYNYYFAGGWVKEFDTLEPSYGYWTLDFDPGLYINYTANSYPGLPM